MTRPLALKLLREGTAIPALPLALHADRSLDEKHQRAVLRYYLAAGVGGIAVGVHTTQFAIRDKSVGLFKPVLQMAVEEIAAFEQKTGKTIVRIAGVCGPGAQAAEEAAFAAKMGYDAVLLSPGGLSGLSEDDMLARTRAVAAILPVIGFYLQPSVGGRKFSYGYWEQLVEIQNVAAIKAAPFNRYLTLDVVRAVALSGRAEEIALYTGNDDNIIGDLITPYRFTHNGKIYEKRFVGGLLGHFAVWTQKAVAYYTHVRQEVQSGFVSAETLALAAAVTDANAAFFDAAHDFKGCIAGLHEVLYRQGIFEGIWCLDKNETLSEGQKAEIDRVYRMYPQLNDDAFVRANIQEWLK